MQVDRAQFTVRKVRGTVAHFLVLKTTPSRNSELNGECSHLVQAHQQTSDVLYVRSYTRTA